MRTIYNNNKPFLLPYCLFLIAGGIILFALDKSFIHLSVNAHHNEFFDYFFMYITYLGDGVMVVIVSICLLFVKFRYALLVAISNVFSSAFTQLLKQYFFNDMPRPKAFFRGIADLYFVPGVENYSNFSFPSGHTTVAFTLYFCLALIVNNPFIKSFLFILSLIVGFSRVYLSQHFFVDVYAGSAIAVFFTLLIYYFLERSAQVQGLHWINKSFLTIRKS
jgi:membrane-associated phospholipid phosphatase